MSAEAKPIIRVKDVRLGYDGTDILRGITLDFVPGTLTALVGPNGAGKSTLFSVMAGDVRVNRGVVELGERPVGEWASRALATRRAVLLQDHHVRFAFSVRQVVEMGRQPHRTSPDVDAEHVERAMATADVAHLQERDVTSLSGGEGARAAFARVLAQDCPIVLLDEPTAALDLRHQEEVLAAARELADSGACVIVVLHDLNLAAGYSDRIVILAQGEVAADGTPAEVLTAPTIQQVYGQQVHVLEHPSRGTPLVVTA